MGHVHISRQRGQHHMQEYLPSMQVSHAQLLLFQRYVHQKDAPTLAYTGGRPRSAHLALKKVVDPGVT